MLGRLHSKRWVVYGRMTCGPRQSRSITRDFVNEEDATLHIVKSSMNVPTGWVLDAVLVRVDKHEVEGWNGDVPGPRYTDVNHVLMRIGDGRCWDGQ